MAAGGASGGVLDSLRDDQRDESVDRVLFTLSSMASNVCCEIAEMPSSNVRVEAKVVGAGGGEVRRGERGRGRRGDGDGLRRGAETDQLQLGPDADGEERKRHHQVEA